ncbi:phosphoglucomutase/phosphomannomutase PgmG [Rhodospirillum sp. A1_3_36]|uniref:phosphoglucomutase/phosphomannomutase PgmG n=1 Tax=Rhodospirillum sp. A1_3_36 TaxID=3391666 RepID=UPI0039A6568B
MIRHDFHSTILRAYDIRGIVGETLFEADARAIGAAYGTLVKRGGGSIVCVGYDGRVSSPALEAAVVEGLMSTGMTVRRVGRGPTPLLYFAVKDRGADAGIMITGSHNPPDHNGFKMLLKARPFYGDDIVQIGSLAAKGDYETGEGRVEDLDLMDRYIDRLLQDFKGGVNADISVVWDAGNGAAGEAMAKLTAKLPGKHRLLFQEIDGSFPNHHPDPTEPENLEDLIAAVAEEKANLGIAFDGDGDRIGIIDGAGKVLWGDQILMLLAREVLAKRPGAPIIADVKASQSLFEEIARLGGQPLMWKTGHSLVKVKMAETGAPLAGEMSGHIFMADTYYGYDDALYAAVRMLNVVLALKDMDLAAAHAALPKAVNTPELRFDCPDERKFAVMTEVADRLKAEGASFSDVDGVRVNTDKGWWLLRASNTQAVLVARCEAKTEVDLESLKDTLSGHLKRAGLSLPS